MSGKGGDCIFPLIGWEDDGFAGGGAARKPNFPQVIERLPEIYIPGRRLAWTSIVNGIPGYFLESS
jgi:hypothetical protein